MTSELRFREIIRPREELEDGYLELTGAKALRWKQAQCPEAKLLKMGSGWLVGARAHQISWVAVRGGDGGKSTKELGRNGIWFLLRGGGQVIGLEWRLSQGLGWG